MLTLLWYFCLAALALIAFGGLLGGINLKRELWRTWEPGSSVSPIFASTDLKAMHFFTPPPKGLGEILFAHSTMLEGHKPTGTLARCGYAIGYAVVGVAIAFWLTRYATAPGSLLVNAYITVVTIGMFFLGLAHEPLQRCIYVGEFGTRWIDGSPNLKRVFRRPIMQFIFANADNLKHEEQEFRWTNWHDQTVYEIRLLRNILVMRSKVLGNTHVFDNLWSGLQRDKSWPKRT